MVVSSGKSLKSFDQGQKPSLLLDFARRKSLIDQVSKTNLITFTRATSATYVGADGLIKTAASGEARFDHNPVTGESLGLLIEENRTNLLTYSEQFDNAAWPKTRASIQSNVITAPDGTLTGDKFVEDTSTDSHFIRRTGFSSAQYAYSIYAKAGERNWFFLFTGTIGTIRTWFDLSNGIVGTSEAGHSSAKIEPVGNGWYRCSVVAAAGIEAGIQLANADQGNVYTGDGVSGIYVWGAQLEAGSFPTSYIPTTTAAVTRNVDNAVISGANFTSWYNQNQWTMIAEASRYTLQTSATPVYSIGTGTASQEAHAVIQYSTNKASISYVTSGTSEFLYQQSGNNSPAAIKIGQAMSPTSGAAAVDGYISATDSSINMSVAHTVLRMGTNTNGLRASYNGTIKRLIYWPTRLDNSDLQEATR